jgi:hypothetical protein
MIPLIAAAAIYTAPFPAMTEDWFSGVYDWPKNGLKRDELSDVEVAITVNPHGAFQNCSWKVHSGNPQMGPYVCERLRIRGVFEPARSPDGKRMYGVYRTFVLLWNGDADPPKEYPRSDFDIRVSPVAAEQIKHGKFIIQFAVDAEARASSCSLVREVGLGLYREKQRVDPAVVSQACGELVLKMRMVPARDSSGSLVPSVQNAAVGVIPAK